MERFGHRAAAAAATLAAALGAPATVHACSVCGIGPGPSNTAFMISTLFLSFLPLVALGAGVMWLRARIREAAPDEFVERAPAAPPVRRVEPVAPAPSPAARPAEA